MSPFYYLNSLIYEETIMRNISNEQFNEKYYLYKPMIYRIAYSYVHSKIDSEDIVQDVFIKYLETDQYFQTLDNEKYWLIRVTINTSLSFLRKTWKQRVFLDDEMINKTIDSSTNIRFNEEENMFEIIYHLPHKYKEVIILYYYEDLSINQISTILKITTSNVKKRLERARNIIRKKEKKHENF